MVDVADLDVGQNALIGVTADLVDPDVDQQFLYGASASSAELSTDPSLSNNADDVTIRTGVFADGFESP